MPPHAIGSGTVSFGLVSIPVKLYTATSSAGPSFNLLHAKCGSRVRQQMFCPTDNAVVERGELVRGYEFAKEQYVRGPDKGGEKAYRLLADAMTQTERVALATFVMRGKESLVLIRAAQSGLMLHTMYFADEVRDFGEIDKGAGAKIRENELGLAQQLIEGLSSDEFKPERFEDQYRQRVLDLVQKKVEGEQVTVAAPAPPRAQVIDLMEALKESLAKRAATGEPVRKPPSKVAPKRAEPARAAASRKAPSKK
jgi:DNA end-binding protein Ku